MDAAPAKQILVFDPARPDRAKERFYVLAQTGGWGLFFAVQAAFIFSLNNDGDRLQQVSISVMVFTLGLLLTHFSRRVIARWNWKNLDWRALVPRVVSLAAAMSAIWIGIGYGYTHGLLGLPWPGKFSPGLIMLGQWLNGTVIFLAWFAVYFIYHLFDRYNRLKIDQLRLAGSAKEAELRALKSQVNPHFIFNSLNSLRALIDEDPARARQAVTQLANLLRYSLQSGQLETVPFEEELRVVDDYLALEQVRHEERLRVKLDIAPETLALPVPPMLLQTLVENAVKYGISVLPEGGEVAIAARCEHGALVLRVSNPGQLHRMPANGSAASTGVGLRNAGERLRLLFGNRARLELRAATPTLVVAEAILPVPTSPA